MGTEIVNYREKSIAAAASTVLDLWTPIIGGDAPSSVSGLPRWLSMEHRRRLAAYKVMDQFYANVDEPALTQYDMTPVRLGTVAYTIQVLRDVTVGGKQRIVVRDADKEGDSGRKQEQDDLELWAKRNRFYPKLQEAERLSGLLGDAFYRLRIGKTRGTPDVKVDVLHPSFVFPSFDNDGNLSSVALMWEEYKVIGGVSVSCVYKDEYEIGADGFVYETAGWYLYAQLAQVGDLELNEYDVNVDGVPINKLNLKLTQIPVYHLPNFYTVSDYGESDLSYLTHAIKEMNATDTDLAQSAGILGSPQMVIAGLKGQIRNGVVHNTEVETTGPGKVWNVDKDGGKADYLDNSNMLKCLVEYYDRIEDRFFRNVRLGKLFSGATDNIRDIESGKAFKTMLASLYARVAQKRTVRETVYSELFRGLVELFALSGQNKFPEEDIRLEFGNVLPSDNHEDLQAVTTIWAQGKGPISADTAVRLAARAGSGVVDFDREAEAINTQIAPPPTVKPSFSMAKKPAPKS